MSTKKGATSGQQATGRKQRSTVRHTRAIQYDRVKRVTVAPSAPQVEQILTQLIHPATYAQVAAYRAAGLRENILTLPVMVAFVISLIWRQMGSVKEAARVMAEEGMLWMAPTVVTQQAVSTRLRVLPPYLFKRVLNDVLPKAHRRWQERQRPLPPAIAWAKERFGSILALDGSTLDALVRKVGLLREGEGPVLAGRMAATLDVACQLPQEVWYEEDSHAHDQGFWERAIATLKKGTLLIFDLGFLNHAVFDRLTEMEVSFITRAKANAAWAVEEVLENTGHLRDQIVRLGSRGKECAHRMRLVQVLHQGKWYQYLTNVLNPQILPAEYVVALYWQRWRIEDAFKVVKNLLGLSYFYGGSLNTIETQVWATWLLYAVLIDLTDAVAERLDLPFASISVEMVYRGLYHFTQAHHRGAADDPVEYLAVKAELLGVVKRKRGPSPSERLHLTIAQTA